MAKPNLIETTRSRLRLITKEISTLERERDLLERFLTDYETLATEFERERPAGMPRPQRKRLTVRSVARMTLEEARHPLTARELVNRLGERGKPIGGKDPVTNLSSVLSPDDDFISVHWGKARAWWLANRELPPEPNNSGGEEADVSASASQRATTDGGTHATT